ncbi:MAG: nickel pincer cofactor biosynthesis protein LarC [Solirubrobacteraceae bacterium]
MSPGRLLYVDAFAGVAGDMLLGALIDAGAPVEAVRAGLDGLGVDGLGLATRRVQRQGLSATALRVLAPEEHLHRDWAAVRELLDRARLPPRAHARARETFRRLAEAEGRVHGIAPEHVHFHEVGAIDALVDVCGVALALEELEIDTVACSPLPLGRGLVSAEHGVLPLPAPATVELLRGVPVYGVGIDFEFVTPTGAALVGALAGEAFGPLPEVVIDAVGYGAGTAELPDRPNIVRVLLGTPAGERLQAPRRPAVLVECTLDDIPGELVADAVAACIAAGALDAWVAPVQMKKGRPGFVLTVVARPEAECAVAEAMLRHTTTLGVRITPVSRWELEREHRTVEVHGHPVSVKLAWLDGEIVNLAPEYEDVARAAAALGRPTKAVWAQAWAQAEREFEADS